MSVYLLNFR